MKTTILMGSLAVCLTIFMTGAMINRSQVLLFESVECETPHHEMTEV